MSKLIIPHQSHKSQDEEANLNYSFLTRVELNIEKLPVWSTKPKRGTLFVPSKTIDLEPKKLSNGQLC